MNNNNGKKKQQFKKDSHQNENSKPHQTYQKKANGTYSSHKDQKGQFHKSNVKGMGKDKTKSKKMPVPDPFEGKPKEDLTAEEFCEKMRKETEQIRIECGIPYVECPIPDDIKLKKYEDLSEDEKLELQAIKDNPYGISSSFWEEFKERHANWDPDLFKLEEFKRLYDEAEKEDWEEDDENDSGKGNDDNSGGSNNNNPDGDVDMIG